MKPTKSRLQDLKKRIAQAQAKLHRHYGPELKRAIVTYTAARQAQKATVREVATELDVSYPVLLAWMRHARRRQDAGRLPFERTRPDTARMQSTTATTATAAPTEDDDSSST